jgi:DNA polymerase III gamma/tau subunit
MDAHAKSFSTSDVLRMMKIFNNAAVDLRGGWQPSLSIELALAEVLDAPIESHQIAAPHQAKPQPVSVSKTESNTSALSGATQQGSAVEAPVAEKPIISSGDIIKSWKHLAASLPKSQANLSALLNSVKMIDVQGKTLVLGLASDVLVSKLDKPDQIEAIQKLIKDNFNVELSVRCTVTNAKGKVPANIAQDGMVAAAIHHGGEIVDM